MKNIFLLFIFILINIELKSQNYVVGVPVNDTLCNVPFYAFNNCYPEYDFDMEFPNSTVTGISHILIFSNVSPANSVYTVPGNIINSGDTLFFSASQDVYRFYFPSNGSINCMFKAIGIPQVVNETYACGNYSWIGFGVTCQDYIKCSFESQCVVASAQSINNVFDNNSFSMYPNPASSCLNISNAGYAEVIITDIPGKEIIKQEIKGNDGKIDVSGLKKGLYFIKVSSEVGVVTKRFVKE